MLDKICRYLDQAADQVIDWQRALTAIPALGPRNGGEGEKLKAEYLLGLLNELGLEDIQELPAPDRSVPAGFRPNLSAKVKGQDQSRTLWIISHMDIVPPGDLSLWKSDPYAMQVDGDKLIGRGVEDNQQGIVSSLLLAKALKELNIVPPINLGVLLVSDEETGSVYGLEYILREHPTFFSPSDLIVVPDFGDETSVPVEVAEKHMFQLKITVTGRQCHASTPNEGVNAFRASADLIMRLDKKLKEAFSAKDPAFDPPVSTFEPTKKEANVPNINTVPGRDVFYMDCRILPGYDLDTVYMSIRDIGRGVAVDHGVSVEYEVIERSSSPPTDDEAPVVIRLCQAIERVYGRRGRPIGIGGGTVAAGLRRSGLSAVVWATWLRNAHQPNETSLISFNIGDAKVMAHVLMA